MIRCPDANKSSSYHTHGDVEKSLPAFAPTNKDPGVDRNEESTAFPTLGRTIIGSLAEGDVRPSSDICLSAVTTVQSFAGHNTVDLCDSTLVPSTIVP